METIKKALYNLCAMGLLGSILLCSSSVGCGKYECTPTRLLGSCCNDDSDCADTSCIKLKNGICTSICKFNSDCPGGSSCMEVTYTGDQGTVDVSVCFVTCGEGSLPCRSDYRCYSPALGIPHICFP